MKDIVIIAPFKDLYDLSNKIIKEKNYDNIEVVLGDLKQGVEVAKEVVKKGANIIVSRGGTYRMIKEEIAIPVVEIKMTFFDILRGFKDIINYKGPIGVAGYSNIIDGCEVIKEILDIDVLKVEIDKVENAEMKVQPYIEKGVKVFVGDTIGSRVTRNLNCESYMIISGKEAVTNAIEEARRILEISKIEKEKSQEIKTIFDFVNDGIVSINNKGEITIFNEIAKKIFNIKQENIIGQPIDDIVKNSKLLKILQSGKLEIGEIQEVGNSKIATNRVPIIMDNEIRGAVATFQDVTKLQDLEKKVRVKLSKKGFVAKYKFEDIIYKSTKTNKCINIAKKYSKYDSPILITGPSGVGKELFAQSIHNSSKRKTGPFVAINCAALPANLIESELFGYVDGAFTGAVKGGKAGIFELAHGGTIFLDELGEIPIELQSRLLRVLQEREVMRIGDDKIIPIDVRIISATNKNLKEMVNGGEFREDLYFRINILNLDILPLNKRREDIEELSKVFMKKYSTKYNKNISGMTKEVLNYLLQYDYKGNIRELQGIINRSVILCEKEYISLKDIIVLDNEVDDDLKNLRVENENVFEIIGNETLKKMEEKYIKYIIKDCDGCISKAANILDINRSTIWRKLKKK